MPRKKEADLFVVQSTEITQFDFEGKEVKRQKNGFWKCPFGCHTDNRFPQPKWKTLKGIKNHLEHCPSTPSAIEEKEAKKRELELKKQARLDVLESLKSDFLATLPYKLGDEIYYVREIIVQDTHEWRLGRWVKVRYEPVLRFEATKVIVQSIGFSEPQTTPTIEDLKSLVYFNSGIRLYDVMDYEKAIVVAKEKTLADEKWRHECASYR